MAKTIIKTQSHCNYFSALSVMMKAVSFEQRSDLFYYIENYCVVETTGEIVYRRQKIKNFLFFL